MKVTINFSANDIEPLIQQYLKDKNEGLSVPTFLEYGIVQQICNAVKLYNRLQEIIRKGGVVGYATEHNTDNFRRYYQEIHLSTYSSGND